MARLIPHTDPSQIDLEPERKVAEALVAQLPAKAVVFHSYPWLKPERDLDKPGSRPILREGEADFILLHPRYGILVVEVKGGHLAFDPSTQKWVRKNATYPVKDPFTQAANNLHVIEELLQTRSFSSYAQLPFSRARCVVFPHCDYDGMLPPGAHQSILFTASDIHRLGEKIEALFRLQPFVPKSDLSRDTLDAITRALTSTFQLVPSLWAEVEEQERKIFRFTETQAQLLTFLGSHNRATIQGVAGSGKTMLAVAKARAFADEGKKVLLVCFNEMLAEWITAEMPEYYSSLITVRNYHKLCRQWVKAAGFVWPQIADEATFFTQEAPVLLERAIEQLPTETFDAVVADEGQDFLPAWWDTLELINKRPMEGSFYIFYDPDQQIFYDSPPSMPDLGNPFVLPVNCRNTGKIVAQCSSILGKRIPVNSDAPEGRPPTWVFAPTGELQRKAVERQLKEWCNPIGGLRKARVAIVTCGKVETSSLGKCSEFAGIKLVTDLDDWRSGKGPLVTSLYRFKGLETDALILVDVDSPAPNAPPSGFRPEHFYVGCSRAKHLLTIISRTPKDRTGSSIPT